MIFLNYIAVVAYLITLWSIIPHSQKLNSCVDDILGDKTITQRLEADFNADGIFEEVIIYGNKDSQEDSNSFFAILDTDVNGTCQVLFEYELKGESKNQTIHTVEIKEITGEGIPEIYVSYDIGRGSHRSSFAYHYIFGYVDNGWQEIFVSEACLISHYFEFRENPDSIALDVYTEDDRYCEPEFVSNYAVYTLYRWDGEYYELYEQGDSTPHLKDKERSFWISYLGVFCCLPSLVLIIILLVVKQLLIYSRAKI